MLFSETISYQVFLVQIKRHVLGTTIILFFFLASNMMISTVLVGNTQVSAGAWCSWLMRFRLHTMKTGLKCLTLSLAPCHHFVPYPRKLYICLSLPKFLISGRNICSGYPWQGGGGYSHLWACNNWHFLLQCLSIIFAHSFMLVNFCSVTYLIIVWHN